MRSKRKIYELEPQYRERVWGGQRLKANDPPIGEAWIAFEESRVLGVEDAGRTLMELAQEYGARFLGSAVAERFGARFPLLVKLLDCADWLSVQVHPNDEQARRLVGPDEFGKTEAWHFLEVEPGATILAGVREGTSEAALAEAIREGRVLEVARRVEVRAGETYLLPSGTLHALGPGMLLYEVQQSSDTTYRVYDWDRPASAGRRLHIEESVAVTDPRGVARLTPAPALRGTATARATLCPFFELELLQVEDEPLEADTRGLSFHVLTMTKGSLKVVCGDESARVGPYQTALVAGDAGAYAIEAEAGQAASLLRASVPVEASSS